MTSLALTVGSPHLRQVDPHLPVMELLERRNFLSAAHHHVAAAVGRIPRNPTVIGQVVTPTPAAVVTPVSSVLIYPWPLLQVSAVR